MYRNHEYHKDPRVREAIRRASKGKKRVRPWGYRLTYRIGEVMGMKSLTIE